MPPHRIAARRTLKDFPARNIYYCRCHPHRLFGEACPMYIKYLKRESVIKYCIKKNDKKRLQWIHDNQQFCSEGFDDHLINYVVVNGNVEMLQYAFKHFDFSFYESRLLLLSQYNDDEKEAIIDCIREESKRLHESQYQNI